MTIKGLLGFCECKGCRNRMDYEMDIVAHGEKLLVVGQYAQSHIMGGCWVIGVSMYDEGRGIPKWPVRVSAGDCTYSPTLEVDVPDDFELTWYSNGMQVHP